MQGKTAILTAMLLTVAHLSFAQVNSGDAQSVSDIISPFFGHRVIVPEGYAVGFSAAFAPYDKKTNFAYGSCSLSFASMLEASIANRPHGTDKSSRFATADYSPTGAFSGHLTLHESND